jgi:hypothetical protein
MQRRGCIPTEYTGWLDAQLSYSLMVPLDDGCMTEFFRSAQGIRCTGSLRC